MESEPLAIQASTTSSDIPVGGFDIFSTIVNVLGGNETTASLLSLSGFLGFLNVIWNIFAFFALLISALMLAGYAYASTRRWQYYALGDKELRDEEARYDEMYRGIKKTSRLDDVYKHIASVNPNDWKLAIIEADIVLDETLKQLGYSGGSLGERLKSISPQQMTSLHDAWEAHKVRNRIAHDGADFVLTHRMAEETINRYRRVFSELGV
jgi:hypothetical protein